MAVLFIILACAAIFHFIYESIMLPNMRLDIRYKLFALRDELRMARSKEVEKFDKGAYDVLDDSICAVINRLPHFTLSTRVEAYREFKTNERFRNSVERRKQSVEQSSNESIKEINAKFENLAQRTFILNLGGWMYIVLPLVLAILIVGFISSRIKLFVKNRVILGNYKIVYATNQQFLNLERADCEPTP